MINTTLFRSVRVLTCAALVFSMTIPAIVSAQSTAALLNATDAQSVTRADFIRAVVKADALPLLQTGTVPFSKVPDALLPYVRAAQAKRILGTFSSEGKALNFQKTITRGEAIGVLADLLAAVPSDASKTAAKKFTDATTGNDTVRAALAVERNWMKPVSTTLFGLKQPLRGKEGKLLLGRVFQMSSSKDDGTETLSSPVIRVNILRAVTREPAPKADMLEEVWNALRTGSLYRDRLDADTAGDQAIQGLVNSVNDPYTVYMPKEKNDDFKLQMKGEVEGIGATVEMTGGVLTIVSPLRGSPAEKAGLKPKDQILSVDGTKLQGLSLDAAVRKVRGPKDSSAVFHIGRNGTEFDVTITRAQVTIPELDVSEQQNVEIVKIQQFWDTTDTKFRDVMAGVQSKNPRGIILDLRNNPGGLLHAAGIVVGSFLPKGSTYVTVMEPDNTNKETTNDDPVINAAIPLVVLVNKGSASASEIVAGALQDAGRAKVVGETSYGKGTVQQVVQFSNGASLKYTIAEWRTPLGRKIDKLGVTPDFVVTNGDSTTKDLQMEKAMELIR